MIDDEGISYRLLKKRDSHKVYRQPILSAFRHCPSGTEGLHEKLPIKPQPTTEATSWPTAHHAERRVKVH